MNKKAIVIAFLLASFVGYAQTTTNDWSHRITSKTKHTLESIISPHANPINVLIIDGKRFEHVRGLKKFYLQVPSTNLIIFVTDKDDYADHSATYHVFNMDTDEDISIHASSSVFGSTIGADSSQDSVGMETNRIIKLCNSTRFPKDVLTAHDKVYGFDTFYYLDLNKKAVIAEKTLYYGKDGKLIDEHDSIPPF
jgi:hypothetical protein